MRGARASLIGFMAMAFAVVGMTGLLAVTIAPLPLHRALQREAVLDEALAAAGNRAALEALRPRLGDSAAAVLAPGADVPAQVAAERIAQRARRIAEAEATGRRLMIMLGIVTLLAAAFGVGMLMAGRRIAPDRDLR
jgi:hypothetical protein